MAKGGGGVQYVQTPPQTTTTKTEPWEGIQPFLKDVLGRAQTAANATPTTPSNLPVLAGVNPLQTQANAQRAGVAGNPMIPQLSGNLLQLADKTASGGMLQNPTLGASIEAQVRPLLNQVKEQVMPGLASDAWNSGFYGGERFKQRQNQILRDTNQAVSDATAKAVAENYGRERVLQTQAPQLAQSGIALGLTPSDILSATGAEARGWSQEEIDAARALYSEELAAPWQAVNPYAALVNGISAPVSSSVTGSQLIAQNRPNTAGSILSGALGGGSLASGIGTAFPALSGLAGPWGMAGGALLGGLFGGLF